MSFGERLKQKREEKGLTQEELASRIKIKDDDDEITRQSVSKWENGSAYPKMKALLCLAVILQVSIDELVQDEILKIKNPDGQEESTKRALKGAMAGLNTLADYINKMDF